MLNTNNKNFKKGFTLIEVLLVIVLVGILLAIGLTSINIEARFVENRNDTRKTHIKTIEGAIAQYRLQEGSYPAGLDRTYREICDPDASACVNFVDLKAVLVPKYLQAIPQDPNDTDNTGGAGYEVAIDTTTNTVSVRLKELLREGGVIIAVNDPLPAESTTTANSSLVATVPVTPPPVFDFSITPPISGKTGWNLLLDGDLNLSTHGEWTIIPSRNITVNTKIWGAGGASGAAYTTSNPLTETSRMGDGGGGGYSTGSLVLTSGTPYIIQVGEGGSRRNGIDVNGGATYRAGGSNSNTGGAQGGGYSGIFITSVIQSNTLIIAGGGGAGYDRDGSWCSSSGSLGAGGGSNAQNGFSPGSQGGGGATQSAGGGPSIYHFATAGSALRGGLSGNGPFLHSGGGGGGYFGGGGGNICGGGGGSGFINSTLVTNGLTQTGNGSTPANSSDTMRSGSGQGSSSTSKGSDGRIILTLNTIDIPNQIPMNATYSQSSVYSSNQPADQVSMTNNIFTETSKTGTNSSSNEFITLDLGSNRNINRVVVGSDFNGTLSGGWGKWYTENKLIQVSTDNTNWTNVGNTGTFNSGIQSYSFGTISARYVRLYNGGSGYIAVTEFYAGYQQ